MHHLSTTVKQAVTVGAFVTALVLATVLPIALKQENRSISSNVQQQEEFDAKTTESDTQQINISSQFASSNDQAYGEISAVTSDPSKTALEPNCVCFTSEDIDKTVSRLQTLDKNHVTFYAKRSCTGTNRNGIYYTDSSYGYPLAYGVGVDFMNDEYTCVVADMLMAVTPEEGLECKRLIESKCAEHATALKNIQSSP